MAHDHGKTKFSRVVGAEARLEQSELGSEKMEGVLTSLLGSLAERDSREMGWLIEAIWSEGSCFALKKHLLNQKVCEPLVVLKSFYWVAIIIYL